MSEDHRKRRTIQIAFFAVIVALAAIVMVPLPSSAWPWDDDSPDKTVHVYGQVQCNDFAFDANSRYPFARVEGFEIRGRSGVMRNPTGTGLAVTYETDVPIGWVIEWSVKCSGDPDWKHGEFKISKTTTGTSYSQERHVCVGGGIYEPCIAREYGNCITLWITGGWKPQVPDSNDAFFTLYDAKSGGPSDLEGCARALANSAPDLSAPNVPSPPEPVEPEPEPTFTPEPEITPVPEEPTSPSPDRDNSPPSDAAQPSSPPEGSQGTGTSPTPPDSPITATVVIDNRTTNGSGMREDPVPAYLSTVTENRCSKHGCMLPGTEMTSGAQLTVTCTTTTGARTTNGNDGDPADDNNPERYESTRWYGATWSDGRFGYISETWISAAGRGGLGLPGC
jgi:hypothetical protein